MTWTGCRPITDVLGQDPGRGTQVHVMSVHLRAQPDPPAPGCSCLSVQSLVQGPLLVWNSLHAACLWAPAPHSPPLPPWGGGAGVGILPFRRLACNPATLSSLHFWYSCPLFPAAHCGFFCSLVSGQKKVLQSEASEHVAPLNKNCTCKPPGTEGRGRTGEHWLEAGGPTSSGATSATSDTPVDVSAALAHFALSSTQLALT